MFWKVLYYTSLIAILYIFVQFVSIAMYAAGIYLETVYYIPIFITNALNNLLWIWFGYELYESGLLESE